MNELRKKYYRWLIGIILMIFVLAALMAFSLLTGEMDIKLKELWSLLQSKSGIEYMVLTKIRIPRIVLGIAVGGGLSLSGILLQGIYRNPLVEPYTMGISGGAALGVSMLIVFGLKSQLGTLGMPLAGFLGAALTILFVYILSFRKGGISINSMLLVGVMISFVSSSAMMFIMSSATSTELQGIVFWIMGSLDEPDSTLIKVVLFTSLGGLIISIFFARTLNALQLGQSKARHLGINADLFVKIIFLLASLLTGVCVSVTGVIGFVGLVIPHMVRMIIGNDFRISLIGSYIAGAIFLVACDMVARTVIAPIELPIGVITGMIGGIVFIIVLRKLNLKSHA